jgi:hypothetical protein
MGIKFHVSMWHVNVISILVLEEKAFKNRNIKFRYSNLDFAVNRMLELAQHKLVRRSPELHFKTFKSEEELEEFIRNF